MGYYDGDSWTYHEPVWIDCGECEEEFDQQEDEGNICPDCKEKEGESMNEYGYYVEDSGLICPQCADNPQYQGALTTAEAEGYPDGYTCDDCNTTIKGESK